MPPVTSSRRSAPSRLFSLVRLALVATLALSGSSEALAQQRTGTADEAETAFKLGNQAYLGGKLRDALGHYFVSQRLAPNRKVVFNIARCYEQLGELVEAWRYYREHVETSPAPDDPSVGPSKEALARLEPKVALIEVESDPPGAAIAIDRRDLGAVGVTPRVVPVEAGTYRVLLDAPGHRPWDGEPVQAEVGRRAQVKATLAPLMAHLRVDGTPTGATVSLGGRELGALPFEGAVPAGRQTLRVSAPGWLPQDVPVELAPDGKGELAVALVRQTGIIVLSADEQGALVRIDGAPAGFAPVVLDRVPVGKVEVSVELEGFRTWTREVEVTPDAKVELQAVLSVVDEVEAASRTKQSVADAPASVSLVPGWEVRAFDYDTLGDALRGVRGVYLSDDLVYPNAGVRGFAPLGDYGNRIQLQIDGHILNDSWLGQAFLGFDALPGLEAFDRLEVVRGPGSVLYGTGALFGVVNLATSGRPRERLGRVGVSSPAPHTVRVWAEQRVPFGEEGGLVLHGGVSYEEPHAFTSEAMKGSAEAPDGRATGVGETLAGGVLAKATLGDFAISGFFNERDRQPPNSPYDTLYGDTRTDVLDRRAYVDLRWSPELSNTARLTTRLTWDHYHFRGRYAYAEEDGGVYEERMVGHWLGLEARAELTPVDSLRLTFGVDYAYHLVNDAVGQTELDDAPYLDESHPFHAFAAYALGDWNPSEIVSVQAGARYDGRLVADLADAEGVVEDVFTGAVSPRLAVLLRPGADTTLKLLGGTAFRAASLYELTYNDGGLTQVPSPSVEPETVYTGEVELIQRLGEDLSLTVGGYLSALEDYVQLVGEGSEEDPLVYTNLTDTVWSAGFEVELQRQLSRGWMVSVSYALQRTRVGDFMDGEALPNSPDHLVAAKVLAPILPAVLSLTSRLTLENGRKDRDGESTGFGLLWDLGLWGQIPALRAEWNLTVRNVTGWDFEMPVSALVTDLRYTVPGPTVTAEISARF